MSNKDLKDKDLIGKGEYGIVYKSKLNDNDIVIKHFANTKEYLIEKNIYQKILPVYIGKIYIDKILFMSDRCNLIDISNRKIILNKFNIDSNQITISDNKLIDLIQNIIIVDFEHINTISFNMLDGGFITSNNSYNIGHVIKNQNTYELYIDTFKISRLLKYNDNEKLLYFEYLGVSLRDSFNLYKIPDFKNRVYMCIDLIRQINYLINRGVYHNDIKCDNITVVYHNENYYIHIIDFGISISTQKEKLDDYLLTTYNAYSPEYYKINQKYNQSTRNISNFLYLLDRSSHWIIGGIIINILKWNNVQYPIWLKYYSGDNHFIILQKYSNKKISYDYLIDLFNQLLFIEDIYDNKSDLTNNINNMRAEMNEDIFKVLYKNTNYYKKEYVKFILCIINLLEFETYNKNSLDVLYLEINTIEGYSSYVESRKKFI